MAWGAERQAKARPNSTPVHRWLPNPPGASWTYRWTNDAFYPGGTFERYTVAARTDTGVTLAWTSDDAGNAPGTPESKGTIEYAYADTGLFNTNWSSTAPPPQFPVLCASATQCGNSLSAAHYLLIWGSRSPLLQEPLVAGAGWSALGGQGNDVASANRYDGVERVVVPAFPQGIHGEAQGPVERAAADQPDGDRLDPERRSDPWDRRAGCERGRAEGRHDWRHSGGLAQRPEHPHAHRRL